MKNTKQRIEKMQNLLDTLEKDYLILEKFLKDFIKIEKNYSDFMDYYRSNWLQDYDKNQGKIEGTLLGNEDSAYNALQDIYEKKLEILKEVTKGL